MNKLAVIGGSSVLLIGAAWAGTTFYAGQQIVQQLPAAVAKLGEGAPGSIKYVITKREMGFLTSHIDWELIVTPDPCQPEQTMRITGYNVIHNGLFPSLGMGQIETHINWPANVKQGFTKFFGDKEPLQITTNVGLLGSYTTHIKSPSANFKDNNGTFDWQGMNVEFGQNKAGSKSTLSGVINGGSISVPSKQMDVKLDKISFESEGSKGLAGFNLGISKLQAAGLSFNTAADKSYGFKDLSLIADASEKDGFLGIKETLKVAQLIQDGKQVGKVDAALSFNHIDAASLKNVLDLQKKMSTECKPSPEPLLTAAKPLFAKGIKIALDHLDLELFEGKAHADAVVNLPPLSDADMQDMKQALLKLEVDAKANVSQSMMLQLVSKTMAPGQTLTDAQSAEMINAMLEKPLAQGLLTKTADGYSTVFQMRQGQPLINGKSPAGSPMPMMGTGAGPGAAAGMTPEMAAQMQAGATMPMPMKQ